MKLDEYTNKCAPSDTHTDLQLSTVCQVDSDCDGVNGTPGQCVCGLDNRSYCQLFTEDEVYLKLKDAILDFDYHAIATWEFATDFWVNLQTELPDCVIEVWPDLREVYQTEIDTFEEIIERPDDEDFGSILGVTFTALWIVAGEVFY
jgi:hypothetical protein